MIEFINSVLQFDFIVEKFFPIIVKLLIFSAITGGLTGLFIMISSAAADTIFEKFMNIISCTLIILFLIVFTLCVTFIIMIPIFLCTIALKLYIMSLITSGSEFIIGIISAFICICIFVIGVESIKK